MSFRGLRELVLKGAAARGVLHEHALGGLAGRQLVVDGRAWLARLAAETAARAPLAATRDGLGVPPGLGPCTDALLAPLAARTAGTVVVFDGLAPQSRARARARASRTFARDIQHLWHQLAAPATGTEACDARAARCAQHACLTNNTVTALMEHLLRRGVEAMRAPYTSWAQIAFLLRRARRRQHSHTTTTGAPHEPLLPVCLGEPELLLFGVDTVILAVDTAADKYLAVDRAELLRAYDTTEAQLTDACLVSRALEALPHAPPTDLAALLRARKEHASAEALLRSTLASSPDSLPSALREYRRWDAFLHAQPVLNPETCCCQTLDPGRRAVDLGPALPDLVYFFIGMGFLTPEVVQPFVDHVVVLQTTVADTSALRRIEPVLLQLKRQSLAIIADAAEVSPPTITALHWDDVADYDDDNDDDDDDDDDDDKDCKTAGIQLLPDDKTSVLPNDFRRVTGNEMSTEFARQGLTPGILSMDIAYILQYQHHLSSHGNGGSLVAPVDEQPPITSVQSALCHVLILGLYYMNYITASNEKPLTDFGTAVLSAITSGRPGAVFKEETLTFLELIRDPDLFSAPLVPLKKGDVPAAASASSSSPSPVTPQVALLTRVFSLVPLDAETLQVLHEDIVSHAVPADFALSAFNVIVQSLWRELHNLFEAVFVALSLKHIICVPPSQCRGLYDRLPFKTAPTNVLGLVLLHILSAQTPASHLQELFPQVALDEQQHAVLVRALRCGTDFWDHISHTIQNMVEKKLADESLLPLVESSDALLHEKLGFLHLL